MPPKAKAKSEEIFAPSLQLKVLDTILVGDSPLISHAWSTKAKEMILQKQQKKASKGKEVRNPHKDFIESLYVMDDGFCGFPVTAFKSAAVTVCSQIENITKVFARQTFHIQGPDLTRIWGDHPEMREDMVRIGMGTSDLRFRGEFRRWWVNLKVEYNASAISEEQLVNIFNISGFGVGVGEWRPERDGRNGRYHVASGDEEAKIRVEMKKPQTPPVLEAVELPTHEESSEVAE